MQVSHRTPITQLNYSRYAISFFVNGDSELLDILDVLKTYCKVLEITFKTHKNTAIKTGEHTVYLQTENPSSIPRSIKIGGDNVILYHKSNIICQSCNATGHSTTACQKVTAK